MIRAERPAGGVRLLGVNAASVLLAALVAGAALAAGAAPAAAGDWTLEGNLLVPDRSLKAHQPGPGLSLQWEEPLAPRWRMAWSTGYWTLLTKRTPSYQMVPLRGGVKWVPRGEEHGPYLATDLGLAVVVESFRFLFGESLVTDDDWALTWGPELALGYRASRLEGGAGYQLILPRSGDAGLVRIRMGYRF